MIVLDYQDRRPLYEQITEKLQMLIIKGVLKENEQMPSVRNLAMELSINPNTIQKAYAVLEQEGFIYAVKGKGNFVSGDKKLLIERRKTTFFLDLRNLLREGMDMGVSRDECVNEVEHIYEEGIL